MDSLTVQEILKSTGGTLLSGDENAFIIGFCTDSRILKDGDLFIALIGEKQDAHKFLNQVADNGGKTFLISDEEAAVNIVNKELNVVLVRDTLEGLQSITKYYLEKIGVKKIAITGSVGKTSTRDMVYSILSQKYRTGKPIKNYNSDVGIPLTVSEFPENLEIAVLEEGMEHAGEIHRLAKMTEPDVAIITNIGVSHLENLGTRENILKAKMEITDFFGENNVLIINASNDMLSTVENNKGYRLIKIGETGNEDYVVSDVVDLGVDGIKFKIKTANWENIFSMKIPGVHNAINGALAIAACEIYGLTAEDCQKGLNSLELTGKRLKLREGNGVKILDDSYNAAPDSVKGAIKVLENTPSKRKVAILGAMNEIGENSKKMHFEVGEFAAIHGIDLVIGVEEKAQEIVYGAIEEGCKALYYSSKEELYEDLSNIINEGDLILTKASMTRHFWEIADEILK